MSNPYANLSKTFFAHFMESDPETDAETVRTIIQRSNAGQVAAIRDGLQSLLGGGEISLAELGTETNRWFGTEDEARDWLETLSSRLNEASSEDDAGSGEIVVKDSNGTVLNEGDSVTVIKDLKVKGGSSDLKRGTMIKNIHLVGDRDTIECRVNGSTLVLRVEFLKKA